jgi:hypothetical protein
MRMKLTIDPNRPTIINHTGIHGKYSVGNLHFERFCTSACNVTGTYIIPPGEDEDVAKELIGYSLEGTFGGYFTRFGKGKFLYTQCTD